MSTPLQQAAAVVVNESRRAAKIERAALDETVDPFEGFVSLAQERDIRFLDGIRVVVVGTDPGLGIQVGEALLLHCRGAETRVHVVEARDALEGLADQLKLAATQIGDFEKAVYDEASRCRIVTSPTPYRYVAQARQKQKAQWKQERSRVRRR